MSLVFFTDRDLGKKFPELLRADGLHVETHADHFAPTASDEEWLTAIGQRGWIALTHDQRIRFKPNELAAVMEHQVALLVLIGHATTTELAVAFIQTRSRIEKFIDGAVPPYIAKVHRPSPAEVRKKPAARGRIEHWYP